MNENRDFFDEAIDAAAKELVVNAPDTLLKGIMYRIEKDEKPKRFAFGRFTAIAGAAAVVILTVGLGGRFLGVMPRSDNAALNVTANNAPQLMDAQANDSIILPFGGIDNYAAKDSAESGASEANAPEAAPEPEAEPTRAPMIDVRTFIMPVALPPNEQAVYDYATGIEKTVLSLEWDSELTAVVGLSNANGVTETLTLTLEENGGVYTVVKAEAKAE